MKKIHFLPTYGRPRQYSSGRNFAFNKKEGGKIYESPELYLVSTKGGKTKGEKIFSYYIMRHTRQ